MGPDWGHVNAPTTSLALTGTTIAATQQVDVNTIKTQTVTAAAGVTFPTSIASPTNITAASGVALAANQHVIVDSGTVTTLTTLPAITTDWISAAGVSAAAVTKIQSGLSTYAGTDTSGTTTLLDRLTSTRSGYLDNLSGGAVALASGVTVTTNNDKGGYTLTQTFPSNFSLLSITAGGHISNVDTLTTYTGNTPSTGDTFARIGVAGVGLTNLGDVRIAHLDADVSTRLPTSSYTAPVDVSSNVTAIKAKTDLIATNAMDSANAVTAQGAISAQLTNVAGKTTPQALKYMSSILCGLASGGGTGVEVFKDFSGATAVTVTVDNSGNRASVVLA